MASAAAMSAARSMPSVYTVPLGPRVRPPRLLPGTKAENTNPQPQGEVPSTKVWVQGKWREQTSNAAKDRRLLQSTHIEKALRHPTHGMNIYAYRQIRTNQVVYSLSRVMQNNKILSQLIFHGKQTKPAALRRDVWRPYFSIHFPKTEAGAMAGLDTFQLLRELSSRRQLSPPEGSLIATEQDVENARSMYEPAELEAWRQEGNQQLSKLPKLGRLLPLKYRARKLMDQKASSVADVAFALARINDAGLTPDAKLSRSQARTKAKEAKRTQRNRKRLVEIRKREDLKEAQIKDRQSLVDAKPGQLTLDKHAAMRIALDHNGVLTSRDRVTDLSNIPSSSSPLFTGRSSEKPAEFDVEQFTQQFTAQWNETHKDSAEKPAFPSAELEELIQQRQNERRAEVERWQEEADKVELTPKKDDDPSSRHVLVLWSDMKDAMNAQSWSSNVQHDWLDAKAVVKAEKSVIRQPAYVDEDGHQIEEQRQTRLFQQSSSPHVMGRDVADRWLTPRVDLEIAKISKLQKWDTTRRDDLVQAMVNLRTEVANLKQNAGAQDFAQSVTDSLSVPTSSATPLEQRLSEAEDELQLLGATYPEYTNALDRLATYSELIRRNRELIIDIETLKPGAPGRKELEEEEHATAMTIRNECDTDFAGFSSLERARQEALADSQSSPQTIADLQADVDSKTIDLVLQHHENVLRELGDDSIYQSSTDNSASSSSDTGNQSRTINAKDLNDMNVAVDSSELDKRSTWSKIKGVFVGGR